MKRVLLGGTDGNFADLFFFESNDDADRVAKAEETSQECLEFFSVMEAPDGSMPEAACRY